ncbi:MAG: Hsp20/alpha crystallin family protein [Candidatus Acidiferrales bacterium]
MNRLTQRRDVFDELFDFRRDFDDMFNRIFTQRPRGSERSQGTTFLPPVECWVDRESKRYNLRVALPAIDPNQVQLNVEGNTLVISGEHKTNEEKKEADYQFSEFSYGRFERTLELPPSIEPDKLNAEYKDGVLEISAPMSAAALPRKIEIKSLPKTRGASA